MTTTAEQSIVSKIDVLSQHIQFLREQLKFVTEMEINIDVHDFDYNARNIGAKLNRLETTKSRLSKKLREFNKA